MNISSYAAFAAAVSAGCGTKWLEDDGSGVIDMASVLFYSEQGIDGLRARPYDIHDHHNYQAVAILATLDRVIRVGCPGGDVIADHMVSVQIAEDVITVIVAMFSGAPLCVVVR